MTIKYAVRVVVGLLVLIAALAPQAAAEVWHLNGCDATLCSNGITGPFGTITTTLTSGKISVAVSMTTGYGLYGGTGGAAFGFSALGTGITISGISGGSSLGSANAQEGGFGTFQYTINGSTNPLAALSTLAFTVNKTGGFTSASDLDIFSTGSASVINSYFAAKVAKLGSSTQVGFAGAGLATPEPATLGLVVTAVAGALGRRWVRRRRKTRQRRTAQPLAS